MKMGKYFRYLGVIFVAYVGFLALTTLQNAYDNADLKKGVKVLYEFRPLGEGTPVIIDLLADHWKIDRNKVNCEAELVSRYEGLVRLYCKHKQEQFVWEVDVVGYSVRAVDSYTKEFVKGFQPEAKEKSENSKK